MPQNTRVAIFIPSLRGGGAERVMLTLATAFAQRGYQVDLVLVNAEGEYLRQVPSIVRIINLGASRVILSLPGLVRYLLKEKPQALLSALNHANVVAILARRLAGVATRLVVSERNNLSQSIRNQVFLRSRWIPFLMRWLYPHADAIVAVSQGVAVDLAKSIGLPEDRITVIYNPVFLERLIDSEPMQIADSWCDNSATPILLAVGRLTEAKGFSVLIKAFALLRKKRPLRLLILGEGGARTSLQTLIDNMGLAVDVCLPGFCANPQVYMNKASVFVLSSRWEGFPNALIEAMACGAPVVSTDCPSGPAEILENGKWGRLVPVDDVDALSIAIDATLEEPFHPDVRRRAADFNIDRAVDRYLAVLGLSGK